MVNTIEPSVCCGDAALCQITLTTRGSCCSCCFCYFSLRSRHIRPEGLQQKIKTRMLDDRQAMPSGVQILNSISIGSSVLHSSLQTVPIFYNGTAFLWSACVADADILFYPCGFLWPPCVADADIIFSSMWFLLLLSFFFSSHNLSCLRVDVYHTSTHDVTLVRV